MPKRPIKMDRINRNILIELQGNARISNNDLADRVGLSPSACLQRVKALEEAGYILQYVMAVDINKLCINVKAYAHITLKNQTYQDFSLFEKGIKKYPELCDCLRVNGEVNYVAFVVCSTIEDFKKLCDELLQSNLGIGKITSYFVLDEPMWFSGYPLEKLEWRNPE